MANNNFEILEETPISQDSSFEILEETPIINQDNMLGGSEAQITSYRGGIPIQDFGVYDPDTKRIEELRPARLAQPYATGSAVLRAVGSLGGSLIGGSLTAGSPYGFGGGGIAGELAGSELAKGLGIEPRIDVNTGEPVSTLDALTELSLSNPLLTGLGIPLVGTVAKSTGALGRASSMAGLGATKADFVSDLKLGTKTIPDEFGKLRVQTRLDRAYDGVKKDGGLRGYKSAEERFIQFKDRVGKLADDLYGHIRDIDINRRNSPIEVNFSTAEEYINGLPDHLQEDALKRLEELKTSYIGGVKEGIDPITKETISIEIPASLDGSAKVIQEKKKKIYDFLGSRSYEKDLAAKDVIDLELNKAIAEDFKIALEGASSKYLKDSKQKNLVKELNQKQSDYIEMYSILKKELSEEKSAGVTDRLSKAFSIFRPRGSVVGAAGGAGFLAGGPVGSLALGGLTTLATSKVGEQFIGDTLETLAPMVYKATQVLGTPAGYAIASLLRNPNISLEAENERLKNYLSDNNRLRRDPTLLTNPILKEGLRADENLSPIVDSLGENPSTEQLEGALAQIQQFRPDVFDLSPIPGFQSTVQRGEDYFIIDPQERQTFTATKIDKLPSSIERYKAADALNRDGRVLPQLLSALPEPQKKEPELESDVSSTVETVDGDKRQEYKY